MLALVAASAGVLRGSPAIAGGPDPCAIVTKADVQRVLGGAVQDGTFRRIKRARASESSAHCDYMGANGNVIVVVHDNAEDYPGTNPLLKQMGMKIDPLNGVGVPAVLTPGHTASFVKHGTYAQVELTGNGTKNDAALVALARIAAGRIR
ncbi:MAG: hypothetical protein NVSMB5_17000 [Candidatus Velthaea sp.]